MSSRQIVVIIISVILILSISIGIAYMFVNSKKDKQKPKLPPIVLKVETEYVKYGTVPSFISASGRVISQQSVDIIAEVQGKLLEGNVSLKKGMNFRKGDLLVRIFNEDAFYTLQSRKSNFLNLLANILPDLKIDYPESYQPWVKFFGEVTIYDDLPKLPEIQSDQEKIFLASRKILSEYFAIKGDEIRLRKYNIYAPYSGALQDVMLEVGSVANPGSRIARIIKTEQLEIEVPVEISAANWMSVGDRAILSSEEGVEIGEAVVVRKSSFVDPSSQSINFYLSVLSGDVYAGEYLKTKFPGANISGSMEIPRNAVFNGNEVFVIDSGYLAKRYIDVLKINEKTIIFRGLDEGEELVVMPLANANVNMAVQSGFGNLHEKPVQDSTKVTEPSF